MPPAAIRRPSGWNDRPSSVQPSAASIRMRSAVFPSQFQSQTSPSAGLVCTRNFESEKNADASDRRLGCLESCGEYAGSRVRAR